MTHRNSQKRFYGQDKIYFITTTVYKRSPFFEENLFCELFIDNLKSCKKLKGFKLYAFNVIFDHVHLLLQSGEKYNISDIMHAIKRHFSRNVNIIIDHEGEVCKPRLHWLKYNEKF